MKLKHVAAGLAALAGVALYAVELSWERDYADFSHLPEITVTNPDAGGADGILTWSLTDSDGNTTASGTREYHLAPGASLVLSELAEMPPLEETVLCLATAGDEKLSGIFGVARPFERGVDRLVAMNVHLGWYEPDDRWQVLQLMRDAGVKAVRVDCGFADLKDAKKAEETARRLEEELLGLEAFGMEPLVLLGYFPDTFYDTPEKARMAFEWTRWLVSRFPGRASWHFGNETNSGWAGFGAAEDMGQLHKAYALGAAAGDPEALRGSFGIAEGLPGYARAFLATGAGDYLEALCVHPYSGSPESGIAKLLANRALLRPDQEIWATEVGFHVDDSEGAVNPLTMALTRVMGFSTEQQADFISRLFILGRAFGIDRLYWYNFFGKNDHETFWLVDGELNPKPAYHTLKAAALWLEGAVALGGTGLDERIQRHFFRRPDGRVFAAVWTQQAPEEYRAEWLDGAEFFDAFGAATAYSGQVTASPLYVLLPEGKPFDGFIAHEVLASAMDGRTFHEPAHRFAVQPGKQVTVPLSVFNAGGEAVTVRPAVRQALAGWAIEAPAAFSVDTGTTGEGAFTLTAPENAVPGVEYHFAFDAELPDGRRSQPCNVRVKVPGEFPYQRILDYRREVDYPKWDPMLETTIETGNPDLYAARGEAAVDGRLDEWKPEEFYELDQKVTWMLRDPELPETEDFTVKVALRWDSERLYAAFLVLDDDLSWLDAVSRDWRDNDNLRLFLSIEPEAGRRGDKLSERELLLIMAASDVERTGAPLAFAASLGGYVHRGVEGQLRLASQLWSGGYALELSLPWSVLGYTPAEGAVLGLNVLADDADQGYRRHTAMTRLQRWDYWMNPKSLGKLHLTP